MIYKIVILLGVVLFSGAQRPEICSDSRCTCETAGHINFLKLSCHLGFNGSLIFEQDTGTMAPITDIEISQGVMVKFKEGALHSARDIRRIHILEMNEVVFNKKSINEIASPSLRIEVLKSDSAIFDTMALSTSKHGLYNPHDGLKHTGPAYAGVSLMVDCVKSVMMAATVFSHVLDVTLNNVDSLRMGSWALQLDSRGIVSHHGPEMIIEFAHVTMEVLPPNAFASSAARVTLRDVNINVIEKGAFSATSISEVVMEDVTVGHIKSKAFHHALFIEQFTITGSTFNNVDAEAISSAVNNFSMDNSVLTKVASSGISISAANLEFNYNNFSCYSDTSLEVKNFNNLNMYKNVFVVDTDKPFITLHPAANGVRSTFMFVGNNISTNLEHIGHIPYRLTSADLDIKSYGNNYGACHCNMSQYVDRTPYEGYEESTSNSCQSITLNCNTSMVVVTTVTIGTFLKTCAYPLITCNATELASKAGEIPLNLKPILIAIVAACAAFFLFFFILIVACKYRNRCSTIKRTCRGLFLLPLCWNSTNCDIVTAASIAQLSVHEDYTEMQPMTALTHEFPQMYTEVATADKATQSLPEELTKEFLENLKERLDDPESYEDAKAVVDHLYELIKAEETCNSEPTREDDENIYDLPLPPPEKRFTATKRERVSVGTDSPTPAELPPLTTHDRRANLCREYFEPRDVAVHVYAEIVNYTSRGGGLACSVPDVLGQAMPRGPYLRALQHKSQPEPTSTVRSTTDGSANMINRPLPAHPHRTDADPGEGTSLHLNK